MDDGQRTQKLRLTVVMASQLQKVILFKTPVCFATVSVDGGPEMKTKPSKGINPGWNESFELEAQASSYIKIEVFRKAYPRSNILIGNAKICLKDTLKDKSILEETFSLGKKGSHGYIAIRLELVSQSQDHASAPKSETLATTSKEPGETKVIENPTKAKTISAAEKANRIANELSHSHGASSVGVIIGGVDDMKTLAGNDCFDLICGYIKKLTNMGDIVFEIHPYAKAAWSILNLIPKAVIAQLDRDQNIQSLWSTAADMLDFLNAAEPVIDEIQKPIVANMLKQIHDCALFVQEYAGKGFCKRALRDTSSSESDNAISQYVDAFQQLKEQFKSRLSLSKLKVFREVREGLVELGGALQDIKDLEERKSMETLLGDARAGAECDYSQACLPNTRVSLLDEIMEWVDDPGRPQYFWLHGPAGTGKSTVANTVSGRCMDLGRLGASFSFKRDITGRNSPNSVMGTLAYQLAYFSSHFREELCRAIKISGNISQQPLRAQLKKYIVAPLTEVAFSGPMVIVVDALDECGDENTREEFLKVWSREASHLPAFVKVIFVSRYENDIRAQLEPVSFSKSIDREEATAQDILAYIDDKMREIHQYHHELPSDWPSQAEKDELRQRADGLFIWVTVACDYMKSSKDPIVALDDVLSGEKWVSRNKHPEDVMGVLYQGILERRVGDLPDTIGLNYFQYIIGSVVVAKTPLTQNGLDALLGLGPATAKDPLKLPDGSLIKFSTSKGLISSLSSILRIEKGAEEDAEEGTIRLLHASVADFLTDRGRCTDARFFIDTSIHNRVLAFRCLETLQRILKRDPCGIADPTKPNREIDDLKSRLNVFLSPDGLYAYQSWHEHLREVANNEDELYDRARNFMFIHLLHLIEVASLQCSITRGDFDGIFDVIKAIKRWFSQCSRSAADDIISLLTEVVQLLQQLRAHIMRSAAHIYISGIPFTPRNTVLFKTFAPELPDLPKLHASLEQYEPSRLITLLLGSSALSPDFTHLVHVHNGRPHVWDVESCTPIRGLVGHAYAPISVAKYSPNGAFICGGTYDGAIFIWNAKTMTAKGHPCLRPDNDSPVYQISITEDMKILALYQDGHICVWEIESGKMLVEWHKENNIIDIRLLGTFVTFGYRVLRVFHLKRSPGAFEEYAPEQMIQRATLSFDGKRAAFLLGPYSTPVIRIVDAYTADMISSWHPIPDENGSNIVFTDNGTRLVVWSNSIESNHARFYDIHSGALIREVVIAKMGEFVRVTADESRLLTWYFSPSFGDAKIFDLANGQQTANFAYTGDGDDITDIRYIILPSGSIRLVMVSYIDVTIWNPVLLESNSASRHVTSLIPSPTSRQFAVSFSNNTIELSDFDGNPSSCTVLPGARPPFAFTPNGSHLLCASSGNTLLYWNLAETTMRLAYLGHSDSITALAFSADGTHLVTASQDSTIRIWDVESECVIRSLPCNSFDAVESLSLSLDKSRVSYAIVNDHRIQTLDAISGLSISHRSSYSPHHWASFSPEATQVVCVSPDNHSCLRDGHTGQYLSHFNTPSQVTDTVFSHNASHFVTLSELEIVDIVDTSSSVTKTLRQTLKSTFGTISSIALSFDGKYILVGTESGYVSMSEISQGMLLWEAFGFGKVQNMVFSSHGDKVAIVSSRTSFVKVYLYDALTGTRLSSRSEPDHEIISIKFSPDETQLISARQSHLAASDTIVAVSPFENNSSLKSVVTAQREGGIQVISHDGSFMANAHKDYVLTLYKVADSTSYIFAKSRDKTLSMPAFSTDGSILACVVAEKEIWIWDSMIPESTVCQHAMVTGTSIISIEISSDAEKVVYCAEEKKWSNTSATVIILDIKKNQVIANHFLHQDFGGQISLIPGNNCVISTLKQGFEVWDALLEDRLFTYDGMVDKAFSTTAVMSPDGTRMLLLSDSTTELWDIRNYTKSMIHPLVSMHPLVTPAAFSPHGKYIASHSSSPPAINIHDAFTGELLCSHYCGMSWLHVSSLSISEDATRILVSSIHGNILIWHTAEPYTSMNSG